MKRLSEGVRKSETEARASGLCPHTLFECVKALTCGMCRSRTTQSGWCPLMDSRNSAPDENVSAFMLAERSSRATKEIASLIAEVQKGTSDAVAATTNQVEKWSPSART